jgi:predicted alpha/beta hydrolase family esterase
MSRVFLIHGYGGWPEEGWRPWLKTQLERRGHAVSVPAMPDTDHPRMRSWVDAIRGAVGEPRPDDAFVGHSLGCIAIIRSLESFPPGSSIGRAVFVAGFYEDLGDDYAEIRDFLDTPVAWDRVKAACPSFAVVHSDDDDAVPVDRARDLAGMLGVPLELHHGYGHFSHGDGVTELPLVLEKLE